MDAIPFPDRHQTLFLNGTAGPLEATVSPIAAPRAVAVICAPHPQQGGTMDNKVVTTLHNAFHAVTMHTVRFNYRGVGHSAGSYGQGQGEANDLITVLDWVSHTCSALPLYLAGFSFGAYISYWIAGMTAYQGRIQQLISIAPPVHYPQWPHLPQPSCPWLVIQGKHDEIVDANAVSDWVKHATPPAHIILLPATGHFFHGQLIELKKQLINQII